MLEAIYSVDVGCYPGKDFGIIDGIIIKARGIDEMNLVFDVVVCISEDVVLNFLGDYAES